METSLVPLISYWDRSGAVTTYSLVNSLVRAVVPTLVFVLYALARRRLRIKSAGEYGAYTPEELRARFAVTQWLAGAGMLAVGIVIAWSVHAILINLNQTLAAADQPSEFLLLPQAAIWWFLPGFAAITLSWETMLGTWALLGGRREAALYNYWTIAKAGFDSTRLLRIMALTIVLPIAILTVLALPEHTALRSDEIRVRGYGFSTPRIYSYSEARRMTIVRGYRRRDGRLVRRAGIILDFADGRRWSSLDIGEFRPAVDPKLVVFLQRRTGLDPQYADTAADIPRT